MANSDWLNDKKQVSEDQLPEQRWVYFTPVLGQVIEEGWEFCPLPDAEFTKVRFSVGDLIRKHDLDHFWRAPSKTT